MVQNVKVRLTKDVEKDVKNDIKAAKKIWLPWWAILGLIIGSLPIYWLFDHFGRLNIALPTLNCIGMLIFAIVLKWRMSGNAWFWITMTIIAALHVPLLVFIPWTTKWIPATAIATIDSVDLIAILAILSLVGKFVKEPKS